MMKTVRVSFVIALFTLLIYACSTEKNTFINRTYHGTTARYNGYFNANELIRQSISTYRNTLNENFYATLPLDPIPGENDVAALYPSIDTAIVKCTKVIQNHSMPSNDKPSLKKAEHNKWIDENWIMIGISNYYRRDYQQALKSFSFVRKFYSNDPSIYVSDLWMARTNIELGNLTEAGFNLANIDKALENEETQGPKRYKINTFKKKKKKKKKSEEEPATVPKFILFDFEKTKADLALRKNETKDAISHLENALKHAKKSHKARIHYVLGQLQEKQGNNAEASKYFSMCLRYPAKYEIHFNARLKRAFTGSNQSIKKDMKKMLRDEKNAAFKDQIYYAMAIMELTDQNEAKAKEYLTLSAFYSLTNTRQKGMAYEKLGDLAFAKRDYIPAQKYYDSCSVVIDDNYPNAIGVRNKAIKLADLVKAVEIVAFEDSVQRIAKLSPDDREQFVKKVIEKKKQDAERLKKMEAERLRELQQIQNNTAQTTGNSSKWYFNNPKTRTEGFNEFRKLWGDRVNEDNWRRSDKLLSINNASNNDSDSLTITSAKNSKSTAKDSLTVDKMLADVPLTDSALHASMIRLLEALNTSGNIYKEQLNEPLLAKNQYKAVYDKGQINDADLFASYQLYKIVQATDQTESDTYKDHILTLYTNSDYANYLRDPEYFVKKKEREALAEKEYLVYLDRYKKGMYYPIISKADIVIENEKDNQYRAKYMLLKVYCIGQTENDKNLMLPTLKRIVAEYPKSEEAIRANEMIGVIQNGISTNIEADFNKPSLFTFVDDAPQWVIVFLDKSESTATSKTKVSEFNKEFFSRSKLKVSSKIYGDDQSIILIQEFPDDLKAKEFVRTFKSTRKHLLDLQKAKILIITQDNMKILFDKKNLSDYENFYDEFY